MLPPDTFAALSQTLAEYFDACDRADVPSITDLLGAAIVIGPTGTEVKGEGPVADLYRSLCVDPGADGTRTTKHHLTNLHGEAEGRRARSQAYYFVLRSRDAVPMVATSGRLEHEWELRDGGWVILRHRIIRDFAL